MYKCFQLSWSFHFLFMTRLPEKFFQLLRIFRAFWRRIWKLVSLVTCAEGCMTYVLLRKEIRILKLSFGLKWCSSFILCKYPSEDDVFQSVAESFVKERNSLNKNSIYLRCAMFSWLPRNWEILIVTFFSPPLIFSYHFTFTGCFLILV